MDIPLVDLTLGQLRDCCFFLIEAGLSFVRQVNCDESATSCKKSEGALNMAVIKVGDDALGNEAADNDDESLRSLSGHVAERAIGKYFRRIRGACIRFCRASTCTSTV
jgi:hypothetical protein